MQSKMNEIEEDQSKENCGMVVLRFTLQYATEKYFDSQLVYSPIAYNWSQEIKALGYVLINFQIDCFENF